MLFIVVVTSVFLALLVHTWLCVHEERSFGLFGSLSSPPLPYYTRV